MVILALSPAAIDWITPLSTVVLVVITGYYAVQTRAMVDEMRRARKEESAIRREAASRGSARRCFDAVRSVTDEMERRGVSGIDRDILRSLRRELVAEGPLVHDDIIRDHLGAAAGVVHVAALGSEELIKEGLSPGLVALNTRHILQGMARVLQDHLAGRPLTPGHWDRGTPHDDGGDTFPSAGEAASWIRTVGRAQT